MGSAPVPAHLEPGEDVHQALLGHSVWLYSSMASNSGSPRRYEELKQREQTTLVTARVSSGAMSRAVSCAALSVSHRDAASRQTGAGERQPGGDEGVMIKPRG